MFLARGLRWPDAPQVVARARRLRASPAPAIIVLSELPNLATWDVLPVWPALLSLAESLSVEGDQLKFDLAGQFVQPIVPAAEIAESDWLTVQQAAAQHVADVDGLDEDRAKARASSSATRGEIQDQWEEGPVAPDRANQFCRVAPFGTETGSGGIPC